MINLEFLVVALVVGRAVDWIFQSTDQARNKTTNLGYLFDHSLWYALLTLGTVVLINGYPKGNISLYILIVLIISHMIIDNRMIVKMIMYLKGMTWEESGSKEYEWLQRGIDQHLHDVVILFIAMVV